MSPESLNIIPVAETISQLIDEVRERKFNAVVSGLMTATAGALAVYEGTRHDPNTIGAGILTVFAGVSGVTSGYNSWRAKEALHEFVDVVDDARRMREAPPTTL